MIIEPRHRAARRALGVTLALAATALLITGPAEADSTPAASPTAKPASNPARPWSPPKRFHHVGTFEVPANLPAGEAIDTPTSAEIVDATKNGKTLLYTDSPTGRLGFIDISTPSNPVAGGVLDMGGEPTSVAVTGKYALVGVNTSPDFVNPSGDLVVVSLWNRSIVRRIPLSGQPDSVAISPDGRYAAIIIENERDEDLNDGLIPQLPAGSLQVIDLTKPVWTWTPKSVALTGLAQIAPDDPEPEYVDINRKNQAIVSLQENNHLVLVDLKQAKVIRHFSAGTVSIDGIDTTEEELGPQENGLIELTGGIVDRRREPDSVQWINDRVFATANEGDYEDANGDEGGTRSFTLFDAHTGKVTFEAGNSFEHELVRAGHYPEARSENKGNEPEGLEVATFNGRTLLFVGSERGNAVGVYDVSGPSPTFVQLIATGIGPEGIKALPARGLLAVSAEVDGKGEDDPFDIRSVVTLYRFDRGPASYPDVVSTDDGGLPIPWVALSGLSADPADADTLWAVSDSFLAQSWIYRLDIGQRPAVIEERIAVGGPDGAYDIEGIAARQAGGFWLASEGLGDDTRRNLLVRVDAGGSVLDEIGLPAALVDKDTSNGFEGVAVTGDGPTETVYVVVQREWEGDPKGAVYVGRYTVATGAWDFVLYPLDAVESPDGGWVGLSEITPLANGQFGIVERDNQIAGNARIKRVYTVDLAGAAFAPFGGPLTTVTKTLLRDVLSDLDAASISVPDKLEGAAQVGDRLWLATDNDGVDENFGETLLFPIRL